MEDITTVCKHYISVNGSGRIVDGFSDAFRQPSETDICISEQGSYQFRLFPGGEENPALFDADGIPLYRYSDGQLLRRTLEDIRADKEVLPVRAVTPTARDDTDAMLVDHEYRLILLELGVSG